MYPTNSLRTRHSHGPPGLLTVPLLANIAVPELPCGPECLATPLWPGFPTDIMDNHSYPSNVGKPMPDSFFPVAQRSARVYRSRTHRGVSIALMRSVCLHPSGSSTPSATTAPIQSTGQGSCAVTSRRHQTLNPEAPRSQ